MSATPALRALAASLRAHTALRVTPFPGPDANAVRQATQAVARAREAVTVTITCPRCHAAPQAPCRTPSGHRCLTGHAERYAASGADMTPAGAEDLAGGPVR